MLLQLPGSRAVRRDGEAHIGLFWCSPAFFEIAGRTGCGDILPGRFPAQPSRHDMIEGQIVELAAILAGEVIAQEQIESGESRIFGWPHILFERDHAGDLHCQRGAMHFALVILDNVYPVKKHRLDRGLPWPEAQRIIG